MGISDEDTMEDLDKGPIVYQETKVFGAEPYLISVYDNVQKRFCTFEIYSLDTQYVLTKMYPYAEFDNLFRFNAELMNPNRKDGRFHWCIERLEIATIGTETKLILGAEPSEKVPELPIYEMNRKIPTGRMDLKERQRLREQMDMLDIRRAENISKKKAVARQKFLKHIFALKEDDLRRKKEVDEKIALERAQRYKSKEEIEKKEEEQKRKLDEKAKIRKKAVDVKEQLTEEQEEEVLRQVRARWRAADEEKARAIADAHKRKEKERTDAAAAKKALAELHAEAQGKREIYWKGRDDRKNKTNAAWLKTILDAQALTKRNEKVGKENNAQYIQDCHRLREPIFRAQLMRMQERLDARAAEEEAQSNYKDERMIPKKVKRKGKHAVKDTSKAGDAPASPKKKKKGDDQKEDKDGKKDGEKKEKSAKDKEKDKVERALDAVESKMRAEMEEEKRRAALDRSRTSAIADIWEARKQKENAHNAAVRAKFRAKLAEQDRVVQERRLVMKSRAEEARVAELRRKQEAERLQKTREANIIKKEAVFREHAHAGTLKTPASPTGKRRG